jgi:hypothetical protein
MSRASPALEFRAGSHALAVFPARRERDAREFLLVSEADRFCHFLWAGDEAAETASASGAGVGLWVLAVVPAIPGLLFALCYVHLFAGGAWFY